MVDSAPSNGYDAETDRKNASEILDQGRWLFEQHERRSDSAQKLAAAVLAFTGTVVPLVLQGVPESPAVWQSLGVGLVVIAGLVTTLLAVLALMPRAHEEGMPSIRALRALARAHDEGRETPIPTNQFAADLLNAKHLDRKSPLDHSQEAADLRMERLESAFKSLGVTFALLMVLMFLIVVIP